MYLTLSFILNPVHINWKKRTGNKIRLELVASTSICSEIKIQKNSFFPGIDSWVPPRLNLNFSWILKTS